ncbi:MAG TPA: hypothetical protein VKR31_07870 [Rhizomicrobium sp.]|nr:hypothetical protein [Rhizomicrobium sp.]
MQRQLGIVSAMVVSLFATPTTASSYCPSTPPSLSPLTDCYGNALKQNAKGQYVVTDICGLQTIPSGTTSSFILAQNIDATCTLSWNGGAGFSQIAGTFSGSLDGQGHWINALTTKSSGIFAYVGVGGDVANLALSQTAIESTSVTGGALAADNDGLIANVYVSGCVSEGPNCSAGNGYNFLGGIVGRNGLNADGTLLNVLFNGVVSNVGPTGGVVGVNEATIQNAGSNGAIEGGGDAGGLIGQMDEGDVESSNASVSFPGGGFIGDFYGGMIANSYASGRVYEGGFAQDAENLCGDCDLITSAYAVGVVSGLGDSIGGFSGLERGSNYANSYWDKKTSGQKYGTGEGNVGGVTGLTTTTFKSRLPTGFDPNVWSQVSGVSYPFNIAFSCSWGGSEAENCTLPSITIPGFPLLDPACTDPNGDNFFCLVVPPIQSFFEPPLAQLTASKADFKKFAGVYTILPIGQLQLFQYSSYANAETTVEDDAGNKYPAAQLACFGTVHTMLARLVGAVYPNAKVVPDKGVPNICHAKELASNVHIDCLLEDSKDLKVKGLAIWPSSLQKYVTIGTYGALSDSSAESILEAGQQLIVHGTTGGLVHVMLGTSVIKDTSGNVIRLVANDPELGMQVFIDMNPQDVAYHMAVLHPTGTGDPNEYANISGFNFNVDTYAAVTWNTTTSRKVTERPL